MGESGGEAEGEGNRCGSLTGVRVFYVTSQLRMRTHQHTATLIIFYCCQSEMPTSVNVDAAMPSFLSLVTGSAIYLFLKSVSRQKRAPSLHRHQPHLTDNSSLFPWNVQRTHLNWPLLKVASANWLVQMLTQILAGYFPYAFMFGFFFVFSVICAARRFKRKKNQIMEKINNE